MENQNPQLHQRLVQQMVKSLQALAVEVTAHHLSRGTLMNTVRTTVSENSGESALTWLKNQAIITRARSCLNSLQRGSLEVHQNQLLQETATCSKLLFTAFVFAKISFIFPQMDLQET